MVAAIGGVDPWLADVHAILRKLRLPRALRSLVDRLSRAPVEDQRMIVAEASAVQCHARRRAGQRAPLRGDLAAKLARLLDDLADRDARLEEVEDFVIELSVHLRELHDHRVALV